MPEIVIRTAVASSRLRELSAGRTPYWAYAWPGGCLLARYLLDHPHRASHRRSVDLGSGCGIVAIAAAKCGASATAIDADPLAAEATRLNAEANAVAVRCVTCDALDFVTADTDLLLVGDLFYDEQVVRRLIPFLDAAAGDGIDILVGDIGRRYLPRERMRPLVSHRLPDFGSGQLQEGSVYEWAGAG